MVHHKDIIEKTIKHLGAVPDIRKAGSVFNISVEHSIIKVTTTNYRTASMRVLQYGQDFLSELNRILHNLTFDRIETIYLYLNLADNGTAFYTEDVEKLGFFYAGVMPGSDNSASLIQKM